ncbi:hypothetical protein J4731_20630 [Providencia rettgeri]|nr:hypothetical protein [Providencia rettgeri]
MILSVSMPLIFWTKMNDIRLRPLAIFFGWTPAKPFTQARQTHCVRLTTPFSPLYLVAQKCGGQTLRLTGLPPKRNTFTGVHLPSLGRVISFRLPCFSLSSLDAHQDKNKAYRPRFTRLVKSLLATKQVCDFQRFRIVLLVSLHDVKNALRSPQNRSKLSA